MSIVTIMMFSLSRQLGAARTTLLNGRAFYVPKRTVDAAVAFQRAEHDATSFAIIEKLTSVCGHPIFRLMTAFRAYQG